VAAHTGKLRSPKTALRASGAVPMLLAPFGIEVAVPGWVQLLLATPGESGLALIATK